MNIQSAVKYCDGVDSRVVVIKVIHNADINSGSILVNVVR